MQIRTSITNMFWNFWIDLYVPLVARVWYKSVSRDPFVCPKHCLMPEINCNFPDSTVNPLYNIGVGAQWFMTLKLICRCNDFLLFRPRDEKMQKKCAVISTWFAMSESLISNLDKLAETCQTNFRIKFFDKYMYLFLRNNSAKAKI